MENFENRLIALEKTNRRYRILLVCTLVVLSYLIITSFSPKQQVPEVVQAKKFELVNDDGTVLARIENYKGAGAITTFKPDGSILTDIVATKSNAGGIVLYDGKGKKNITFTDVDGGGGSIVINNSEQQEVITLGRNNQNAGNINIKNGSSTRIAVITGDTDNGGAVITYNQAGTQTGRLPN